jgi:hypothetical protein
MIRRILRSSCSISSTEECSLNGPGDRVHHAAGHHFHGDLVIRSTDMDFLVSAPIRKDLDSGEINGNPNHSQLRQVSFAAALLNRSFSINAEHRCFTLQVRQLFSIRENSRRAIRFVKFLEHAL